MLGTKGSHVEQSKQGYKRRNKQERERKRTNKERSVESTEG